MSIAPDEQEPQATPPWTPKTIDDVRSALTACEDDRPEDWPERLNAAWAALRGWSVIRGVSVTYGEVDVRHNDLLLSDRATIRDCTVRMQGPVTVIVDSLDQCAGNEGDAMQAVQVRS